MLRLKIADLIIGLEGDGDGPVPTADGAAAAFVVAGGSPDILVRAHWGDLAGRAAGRLLFDSGGLWQLHDADGRLSYSFYSPVFGPRPYRVASFDPDLRCGTVTLDRQTFAGAPQPCPLEYPLDELIVINRLALEGGVEVHGCGVVDDSGAGYLFAGQSGAGKTTSARLWAAAGATVISDDRVVLRPARGAITMYGTPWHGDGEFAEPVAAPLSQILLLRHGPAHIVRPVSPVRAAALLFSCTFPVFHSADALGRTLALLDAIVSRVPVHTLDFTPTPDIVRFVREHASCEALR